MWIRYSCVAFIHVYHKIVIFILVAESSIYGNVENIFLKVQKLFSSLETLWYYRFVIVNCIDLSQSQDKID